MIAMNDDDDEITGDGDFDDNARWLWFSIEQ